MVSVISNTMDRYASKYMDYCADNLEIKKEKLKLQNKFVEIQEKVILISIYIFSIMFLYTSVLKWNIRNKINAEKIYWKSRRWKYKTFAKKDQINRWKCLKKW